MNLTPQKMSLYLILSCTLIPFLLAVLLSTGLWSPDLSQTHHGRFIESEIFINDERLKTSNIKPSKAKQWSLISIQNNCKTQCAAQLALLQNIKTALGKRATDVNVLTLDLQQLTPARELTHSVVIAAPSGQLILGYGPKTLGKPLLKDLSHLVRHNPV